MSEEKPPEHAGLLSAFAHPSWVVMMTAQMLLGLALFVSLVLKYYMLVFGIEVCTADGETLGNMIRCATTLEMTAHFVLGVAGLRLAASLFVDDPRLVLQPLMIGVVGVLLMYLSGLTIESASWAVAAVLLVLMACLSVLFAGLYLKIFKT